MIDQKSKLGWGNKAVSRWEAGGWQPGPVTQAGNSRCSLIQQPTILLHLSSLISVLLFPFSLFFPSFPVLQHDSAQHRGGHHALLHAAQQQALPGHVRPCLGAAEGLCGARQVIKCQLITFAREMSPNDCEMTMGLCLKECIFRRQLLFVSCEGADLNCLVF